MKMKRKERKAMKILNKMKKKKKAANIDYMGITNDY
jgi:uridine kinase